MYFLQGEVIMILNNSKHPIGGAVSKENNVLYNVWFQTRTGFSMRGRLSSTKNLRIVSLCREDLFQFLTGCKYMYFL